MATAASKPSNYLVPNSDTTGMKVAVGGVVHRVASGSRLRDASSSGKPVVVALEPTGRVRELHTKGELPLSKSQQAQRKKKYFPDSK